MNTPPLEHPHDAPRQDSCDASTKSIAIVGMGCCMPDAPDVATFWQNILQNHVAIREVPENRWRKALYHNTDRSVMDGTYSAIGGFIRYDHFDAKAFRIMPRSLHAIDDVQKLALMATREALTHAGYQVFAGDKQGKPFNRERCAIIMGNTLGGEFEDRTSLRIWLPEIEDALRVALAAQGRPEAEINASVAAFRAHYEQQLPRITEDSMPGELPNCITGRIANVFDLRGPNFTTDAACASTLAALQAAVRGLLARDYDVALIGGADRSMDPPSYVKFSRIGALSAEMSAPFDARASGFVMGEGAGVLVLRRLEDAIANNDTIYSVIRGVGSSSDGRGKGMTAPNPVGQKLAVQRAWQDAGLPITQANVIEAHGTSTPVGDHVEASVLTELLQEAGHQGDPVPLGSVKSMIGHLKSASGAASLIKMTLALHHRTLPPSANFVAAKQDSPLHQGALKVVTQARPFAPQKSPLRAGISSFGFGGTNSHVVLEAFVPNHAAPKTEKSAPTSQSASSHVSSKPSVAALTAEVVALFSQATGYGADELELDHHLEADLGIDSVKQAEVLAQLRRKYGIGDDAAARPHDLTTLRATAQFLHDHALVQHAEAPKAEAGPAEPTQCFAPSYAPVISAPAKTPTGPCIVAFGGATLDDALGQGLAALASVQQGTTTLSNLTHFDRDALMAQPVRLALVVDSAGEAHQRLQEARGKSARLLAARGIFTASGTPLGHDHEVAFLFPGQGSQYLGMLQKLAAQYPVVQATFDEADAVLTPLLGSPLTTLVWPEGRGEEDDLQLRETQICQPAMLTADVAMHRLLCAMGVSPKRVAGHSLGEYAAAVAAEVMSFADALYAVSARGREMADVKVDDPGKMAMVAGDCAKVEAVLATAHGYVIAANKNCHTQTVIAGATAAVDEVLLAFAQQGMEARPIPVSHAFHSAIVAPAAKPLRQVLANLTLKAPKIPLCANVDANYFPDHPVAIADLMAQQLASPVEFIAQVQRLYADNVRIFVEVGPKRALTGFVRNILGQQRHQAFASNHPKKADDACFLELLAALMVEGVASHCEPTAMLGRASDANVQPSGALNQSPVDAAANVIPNGMMGDKIVISGMAVATPRAQGLTPIEGDPFASLLAGDNLIENLPDTERQAIADLNITRFDKEGGRFVSLGGADDVIHLAGRTPDIDLTAYGIDPGLIDALDVTGRLCLATGIDALRDAGLPLTRIMRNTSTGSQLFDRWGLPKALGMRTGVILASAFPGFDAVAEEIARCLQPEAGADPYAFDRKFIFRALSLGHAQLAQAILAQGPNTQINAACASGSQALGIARDWLLLGRCDRVVVVSADDVTRKESLRWFGAGFLAVGTASVETDVTAAAVPFGRTRNGMILGSGAAAFVVEKESQVTARGMVPIAELAAAEYANSAFHGTRLEPGFIGNFLQNVVHTLARTCALDVPSLAAKLAFMSHETYTPARGGSSAAEIAALRHVFGTQVGAVTIANTKGFTGHPMGASLEDAAAIKGLQRQTLPPVSNLTDIDPAFKDLRFSTGGTNACEVAVRFAAGFGSQVAATAYRRRANQEARLVDEQAYMAWCQSLGMAPAGGLTVTHRTLRMVDSGGVKPHELGVPSLMRPDASSPADALMAHSSVAPQAPPPQVLAQSVIEPAPAPLKVQQPAQATAIHEPAQADAPKEAWSEAQTLTELTALFAEHTGYDAADLDPSHALEADLGIDSVKQAEIFALMRERFALGADPDFRLSDVQTLNAAVTYVNRWRAPAPASHAAEAQAPSAPSAAQPRAPESHAQAQSARALPTLAELTARIVTVFAQETGYDEADLAADSALEADLGIDSIKQAEILAKITGDFHIPRNEQLRLSDVPTIGHMARYVLSRLSETHPEPPTPKGGRESARQSEPSAATIAALATTYHSHEAIVEKLVALFAEHTGYDASDLAPDHQFEADLGIDSVKQAEVFAQVREHYGMGSDENFRLGEVQTLTRLAHYVQSQLTATQSALAAGPSDSADQAVSHPAVVAAAQDLAPTEAASGFSARAVNLLPLPEAPVTTGAKPQGTVWLLGQANGQGMLAAASALTAQGATVVSITDAELLPQTETAPNAMVLVLDDLAASDEPERAPALLFAALRTVAQKAAQPKQLMVIGRNASAFGLRAGLPGASAARPVTIAALAGLSGMVKSIAKEWPDCVCRTIDVVAHSAASEQAISWPQVIEHGLRLWGGETATAPREVAVVVGPHGVHHYTVTRHQGDCTPKLRPLPHQGKVVATGGARGVTFELLMELARKRPLDITILARTAPLRAHESPIALCDDAEARAIAKKHLEDEGARITPASVRAWIAKIKERVVVAQNLAALEALGSRVRLLTCDVSQPDARDAAIASIKADGRPVQLLLHGAGMEESRFIKDKDATALHRTWAPKAAALRHLLQALSPQRTVTMGSIAGRFGNGGQVDYAAANEMMAGLARGCESNMLNLAWTAWADVGMATRGSVAQVLGDLGVKLLPQAVGVAMGSALIESDTVGDFVVAGDLGTLCAPELPWPSLFSNTQAMVPPAEIAEPQAPGVRLLRAIDPRQDRGLDDHRIDGVPYLPGVLGIELMQQAAEAVLGRPISVLEDIRFDAPVKFFFDKPQVLQLEVLCHNDHLAMSLWTERTAPSGALQRKQHFCARAPFAPEPRAPWAAMVPSYHLMGTPPQALSQEQIYARYFHGPSFQVLAGGPELDAFGCRAKGLLPEGQWLHDLCPQDGHSLPWAREAAFQAAGLYEMAQRRRMALPRGVSRMVVSRPLPETITDVAITVRPTEVDDTGCSFDIICQLKDGPDGSPHTIVDMMQGYRSVVLHPLKANEQLAADIPGVAQQILPEVFASSVPLTDVEPLLDPSADSALALLLSAQERTHFATLTVRKRRLEWLAGRLVAKRAIAATWALDGPVPGPDVISITADSAGAPKVEVLGRILGPQVPLLSVSHGAGKAIAVVSWQPSLLPGVDIEEVAERVPAFGTTYFTPAEQRRAQSDAHPSAMLTAMWAVKEATGKALGLGTRLDYLSVEALPEQGPEAGTELTWRLSATPKSAPMLADRSLGSAYVAVRFEGSTVRAHVVLKAQDEPEPAQAPLSFPQALNRPIPGPNKKSIS